LYAEIENERSSLHSRLDLIGDNQSEKDVLESEIREQEEWLGLVTKWFVRNRFPLPPTLRSTMSPSEKRDLLHSPEVDATTGSATTPAGYTLTAFRADYIAHMKTNMAPKTVENVERVMKAFIEFIGEMSLSDLTLLDVEKYKQTRKGKVADSTINIDVRTLKAALQVAVTWGKLAVNPFQESKNIRITQKVKSHLTVDEVTKLLAVIKEDWYKRLVQFALLTGLRRGEILNLKPADFDITTGVITIQSSSTYRVKGGTTRRISLQKEAIDILSTVPGTFGWLFTDGNGNQIGEDLATKKFKKYAKDAGLSDDVHFHSMRHTFATIASNKGMTPNILKGVLGHASLKTTEGYIGADADTMREQMKKVTLKGDVSKDSGDNKENTLGLVKGE
jgi:integrase